MVSSSQIEQRATEWLTQRESGVWSPADQAALDAWLEETTHVVAFIRVEAAWKRADRFKALGAGFPRGKVPTPEEFNLSLFFDEIGRTPDESPVPELSEDRSESTRGADLSSTPRPHRRATVRIASQRVVRGLAAALLLSVVAGAVWLFWPGGPEYKTSVGGLASIPMKDGSEITLNTDSTIRVAVTASERHVQLDQGEAFFEVAKDPQRPFIVSVGNKRIIAVGTKFSVRRIHDDVRVYVSEGKVRIDERPSGGLATMRGSVARIDTPTAHDALAAHEGTDPVHSDVLVAAGGVARTDSDAILVQQVPPTEADGFLSWRSGYLVFHESSLADAVAEFNRYNEQKIAIRDPEVASIRLSGKFRTTDFAAFVRLLQDGFPIHVSADGNQIILAKAQ